MNKEEIKTTRKKERGCHRRPSGVCVHEVFLTAWWERSLRSRSSVIYPSLKMSTCSFFVDQSQSTETEACREYSERLLCVNSEECAVELWSGGEKTRLGVQERYCWSLIIVPKTCCFAFNWKAKTILEILEKILFEFFFCPFIFNLESNSGPWACQQALSC